MRKSDLVISFLLLILFCLSVFGINRDIFHYEYTYPFSRTFSPEENSKGNYLMTEAIPVKAGDYSLSFTGRSEERGSGCYIIDSGDQVIFSADIPQGELAAQYEVRIGNNTSVRVGFNYDPVSGKLEAGNISLKTDHVLYKESLFRHALLTFLLTIIFIYLSLRLLKHDLPDRVKERTGVDLPYCERITAFLLLMTVLSIWPVFDVSRFTEGDDYYFHVTRIEALAKTLKSGYIPARIYLGWMHDYGVGSGFYYPDLLLYFPAALRIMGFSVLTSLRIFLFVCTFFSSLTMFIAAKKIGNNSDLCGASAAALYAFAAYRLICVFYRNAVGEVQAFIFFPLIIWGLYEILSGHTYKWIVFALGFWGLLMSHMISLAIAGVLCAVFLLFCIPKIIRDRKIIPALAAAVLMTVCLGAFFLLPIPEQAANNELQINVFLDKTASQISKFNSTEFSYLFLPFDAWDCSVATGDRPYPGWAILFVPLLRLILWFRKRSSDHIRTADKMTVFGMLILIAGTNIFPWELFKWFLMRIQFSWRLFGPASALLCISGAVYWEELLSFLSSRKLQLGIVVLAAVLSGMPIVIHTFQTKLIPAEQLSLLDKQVNGAEYMPPGFNAEFADKNRDTVLPSSDNAQIISRKREGLGLSFVFEKNSDTEPVSYSLPLIYYYGYEAILSSNDGISTEIHVDRDERGLICVDDNGLNAGTIKVRYSKTTAQKTGEIISLITFIFLILRKIRSQKKKKGSL